MNAGKLINMSAGVYHRDPCPAPSLSASIIHKLCSQSPWHAWTAHPRLNPDYQSEEDPKMDMGTIAHALLLEGTEIAEVLDFADWRTNAAKEARDEARSAGKVPILRSKWNDVLAMVTAARRQLDSHVAGKDAFITGKPEQVLLWEEDGVYCRARLDWLAPGGIWDYKTTSGSANPEVVSRTLFDHGYDIQAAWYLRGLTFVEPRHLALFHFAFQETYPPYALSVVALGLDCMMLAEKKILYALDLWKKCLETNSWSGYPAETCYASLPKWEEERWLEREML